MTEKRHAVILREAARKHLNPEKGKGAHSDIRQASLDTATYPLGLRGMTSTKQMPYFTTR